MTTVTALPIYLHRLERALYLRDKPLPDLPVLVQGKRRQPECHQHNRQQRDPFHGAGPTFVAHHPVQPGTPCMLL